MARSAKALNQNRLRSSNITVVISIALILMLLGIIGLIVINAQHYADYVREQLKLEAFFQDELDSREVENEEKNQKAYLDSLRSMEGVKSVYFRSKEEASKEAKKVLGISDEQLFDENIYPPSAVITLKADYVEPDKVKKIIKKIERSPQISEVNNNTELLTSIHENIDRIAMWIIGISVVFLLIVIVLINNSIRLKIFAKRFDIKTMQLVGAQRRFIMKPFLVQGILLGFFSALVAVIVLGIAWYVLTQKIDYPTWNDNYVFLIILIFGLGMLIAFLSTSMATWRYLKLRTDELYAK